MARKRGRELDTKLALLESAWELFQQKGYESASVDAIVAHAGLSKGTFFHYFPTKLELLAAVCRHVAAGSFASLAPLAERPELSVTERLNRLLDAMRSWRLKHVGPLADVWRVLARDENAVLRLKLMEFADAQVYPLLLKIVADGVAERVFSVEDVEETTSLVLAVINKAGAANLNLAASQEPGDNLARAMKHRCDAVTTAIERMLGARPGTVRRLNPKMLAGAARTHRRPRSSHRGAL